VAAQAEVVLVAWDPASGRSRPLSDAERAALELELAADAAEPAAEG
jgi:acyl-CoA thioesterase FadM